MDKKTKPQEMDSGIKSFFDEEWVLMKHSRHESKTMDYYVSNYGRVKAYSRKFNTWRLTQGSKDKRGLYNISFRSTENINVRFFIHKFVAEHFVDKPTEDCEYIIHKDGNKTNNHFSNLLWMTHRDWIEELKRRGSFKPKQKMERKAKHIKMTPAKVALLKRSLLMGKTRKKMLAKRFGITHTQLNRIESGENWGDIEPAPLEKLKQ